MNPNLTAEDYSKAMNFIAQNLLASLTQAVSNLPAHFQDRAVVSQALSAFLANVIYKQFPETPDACQTMLDDISKFVKVQLEHMAQITA